MRNGTTLMSLTLLLALAGCRERKMHWSQENDDFEHSYFNGPDGPVVYVKRKVTSTGCTFGDYPEQGPRVTEVACDAMWRTFDGSYSMRCECTDAGAK